MKEVLSQKNVRYAYVEITAGIGPLRQFMKIRDTAEVYAPIRESHRVGIPCLVVDDVPYIVEGPEHAEKLIQELHLVEEAG